MRIFYDNLNWFFQKILRGAYLVLDFVSVMGEEMTGTLGSRVTGPICCNQEPFSIVSCCNLRMKTSLTTVSLEVLAMLQSKNYDKVPSQGACLSYFLFRFSFMLCFYKRVVASHPIHTILNHPLVQLLQNMNC